MADPKQETTLPYRSACRCPCHRTGAMHAAPCCRPDPALETADDERGMRDCKCMPGRQCRNTGCSEETTVDALLREGERIAALRAKQRASGQPVVACGRCRGDTRYDPSLPVQSILCECCGAPMTIRRQDDGGLLIEPCLLVLQGEPALAFGRGALPEALLDRLVRRGWAITELDETPGGHWFGRAEFLRGSPLEDGPEFLFSVRKPTRDACVAKLHTLVEEERAKGQWTEVILPDRGGADHG